MVDAQKIRKDLQVRLEGRVLTDIVSRNLYATDASMFRVVPRAVVEPRSVEDVFHVVAYARDNQIPIAPRGGGSGLAGESLTTGIVLDFSVHMSRVESFDADAGRVRVQPGVVHGALNARIAGAGKIFGPDPATSSRCTLGGMIANNSTGAHSLQWGTTSRWVRSLTVMLHDGSVVELGPMDTGDDAYAQIVAAKSAEAHIYESVVSLAREHQAIIESTWPDTPRNRHGYLLRHVLKREGGREIVDLAQLFCASEGTLGILLGAELGLCERPAHSGLVALLFRNRIEAAHATVPVLGFSPSAVEIIDEACLTMVRTIDTYATLFEPDVGAVLLVEFHGPNRETVADAMADVERHLVGELGLACGSVRCDTPELQATVWSARKHIAGMINRAPGRLQPVPIVEDVCVVPEKLPDYLEGVDKLLSRRNLKHLCFGHAGAGTVHVRPYLDLQSVETFEWLPEMCDEIYELTLSLGGTISGEHGDGLLRAPFIEKQYGPLMPVFRAIKKAFDPDGILNPGKKTDCRDFRPWRENLKLGPALKRPAAPNELVWAPDRLRQITEACNGCGACRSRMGDLDMCPVFRALGSEEATTRAKANLMRSYLDGELEEASVAEIRGVMGHCIHCKMCSVDCPGGVGASDLMLELGARMARAHGRPVDARIVGALEDVMRIGMHAPSLHNAVAGWGPSRWLLDRTAGIAQERKPPRLAARSFLRERADLNRPPSEQPGPKAVYFVDMFADLIRPELAHAVVAVLEHLGVEIVVPKQRSCGVVHLTYGDVDRARETARFNVEQLSPYVDAGYAIVCSEPTAALMLQQEYRLLDQTEPFDRVSGATETVSTYLCNRAPALLERLGDQIDTPLALTAGHHTPCHVKAMRVAQAPLDLLAVIPGLEVVPIERGCCGIAGTFGMRRKGYDTSMLIGDGLFETLGQTEIDVGVTECSTCKLQMEHGVPAKPTLHPVDLLAVALGLRSIEELRT